MAKKGLESLPERLNYLKPVIKRMAKLAPEGLNEDLNPSRLEVALRKRLRGLDGHRAADELAKDRMALERWLKAVGTAEHPGYWVLGFMSGADLAEQLVRPEEPPPRGPTIHFEAPAGWNVKVVPFRLDLKKGKLIGTIMAIDEFSFNLMQRQHEQWVAPPHLKAMVEAEQISVGKARGKKYTYLQVAPVPWKRVEYLLSVPAGYVSLILDAFGADFDEGPVQAKLGRLRLSGAIG